MPENEVGLQEFEQYNFGTTRTVIAATQIKPKIDLEAEIVRRKTNKKSQKTA